MLFDLRGRGRRRTVRTIYLGLALLMGVGLVGFGIGGGALSGGLFNSLGSGSSSTGNTNYSTQITAATKLTRKEPKNPAAWASLSSALYLQAGAGSNYNQTSGEFTSTATPWLKKTSTAWQRYLALDPNTTNTGLATQMLQVYEGPGALAQPALASQALQIVIAHTTAPAATLYEDLAVYSYEAKNTREGDLAAAKALALTPKVQQAEMKAVFAEAKAGVSGSTGAVTTAASPATVTASSAPAVSATITASSTSSAAATTSSTAAATSSTGAAKSTVSTTVSTISAATSTAVSKKPK